MKKLGLFFLGAYILILVLFSLSKSAGLFSHQIRSLQAFLGGDKSTHLVAAILLGVITSVTINYQANRWITQAVKLFLMVVCLICLDEFLQFFLKTRVFDLHDLYYGLLGIVCGFSAGLLLNLCFIRFKNLTERSK